MTPAVIASEITIPQTRNNIAAIPTIQAVTLPIINFPTHLVRIITTKDNGVCNNPTTPIAQHIIGHKQDVQIKLPIIRAIQPNGASVFYYLPLYHSGYS